MTISQLHQLFLENPIICTDTRKAAAGSIFFALKGERFDANDFAKQALEAGCAYAVVDNPAVAIDQRFIVVSNVLESLQKLAQFHRRFCNVRVIGVTGTNGKTTTKELISAVLKRKYTIAYTQGNLNNHIGVPLTLLTIKPETQLAIIEMGANHLGEIAELCEIAEPDFGIITSIGKAHLEGFGSFENIITTKLALFKAVSQRDGVVFVNRDNDLITKGSATMSAVYYGSQAGMYCQGKIVGANPFLEIECNLQHSVQRIQSQLIGTYNFSNILAACTIARYFEVADADIVAAIAEYQPQNNRSQLTRTQRNTLIVDAYNANPTSMEGAIHTFSALQMPAKLAILGEMRELGEVHDSEHAAILQLASQSNFDDLVFVGRWPRNLQATNIYYFETTSDLTDWLSKMQFFGRTVLLKGSRGIALEKAIEFL